MRTISRFERKYHLSHAEYFQVRNSLRAFMGYDHFTDNRQKSYLVRSLYFDTADYQAFHERNNGNYGRIKLRLRVYTNSAGDRPQILVELKTKKGSAMEKYSSFTSYENYLYFLRYKNWKDLSDPVLMEFERLYRCRMLFPSLLVEYRREGYTAKDGQAVRVTLDHNVSSARAKDLFPSQLLLKPHRPKNIILEIKNRREEEPAWLQSIVRKHSLKVVPNSKYVQGIEIIRPYMLTPRVFE